MNQTLLIAGGLLLFISIIIYLLIASTRKEAAKERFVLKGKLDALLGEHGLTVSKSDFFNNKVIAIDSKKETLLFIDEMENSIQAISIKDIKTCKIADHTARVADAKKEQKGSTEKYLDKIQLEIELGRSMVGFTFYNSAQNGIMEAPLLRDKAEKWRQIIVTHQS